MAKKRLPPIERLNAPLAGVNVDGFTVGSWVASRDGSGTPVAVAVSIHTQQYGDLVLRLKSPESVDAMIQSLLRHKRDVWPNSQ